MADKPTVHLSLSKLRKEVEKPEPFSVALSDSKVITFPDVNAMESEASDALLAKIEASENNWSVLRDWLSPEDCKALKNEGLSRAELMALIKAASGYYQEHYGDQGEGSASAS